METLSRHFSLMIANSESDLEIANDSNRIISNRYNEVINKTREIVFHNQNLQIILRYGSDLYLKYNESKKIAVLICGELHKPGPTKDALFNILVSNDYVNLHDCNGSYFIVIINLNNSAITLQTDRTNSYKVMFQKIGSVHHFFSCIDFIRGPVHLNKPAILSFILNGFCINNQTIFKESEILERAYRYEIKTDRITKFRYWDLFYDYSLKNEKENELINQFGELIKNAIKNRITKKSMNFFSLSGGYDSNLILGEFMHQKNIHASGFSYKFGKPKKDSDEFLAKKLADLSGIPFTLYETYKNNLLEILNENAFLGQAMNYSDDACIWRNIRKDNLSTITSHVWVGDQIAGRTLKREVEKTADLLTLIEVNSIYNAPSLFKYLTNISDNIDIQEYETQRNNMINKVSEIEDIFDKYMYLNFDIRLCSFILSWRNNFLSSYFHVKNPLLDNKILDFCLHLSKDHRKDKNLYIKTAKHYYPQVFNIPRANTSSFTSYLPTAFYKNNRELEEWIYSNSSILDNMFDKKILIGTIIQFGSPVRKIVSDVYNNSDYILRYFLKKTNIYKRLQNIRKKSSNVINVVYDNINEYRLCVHILTLRRFLERFNCNF